MIYVIAGDSIEVTWFRQRNHLPITGVKRIQVKEQLMSLRYTPIILVGTWSTSPIWKFIEAAGARYIAYRGFVFVREFEYDDDALLVLSAMEEK